MTDWFIICLVIFIYSIICVYELSVIMQLKTYYVGHHGRASEHIKDTIYKDCTGLTINDYLTALSQDTTEGRFM